MIAEAKDQTDSGISVVVQENINDHAPKVRKPYTIRKQREKWTEEEHQRFVEALKLYGRAWRQIEDHVGTKTAIQIRSHAQKFFAKLTRESSMEAEGSSSPIQIPPPRPKKKPLHPYPRKIVEGLTSDVSIAKRENNSPKSVLSPIGSDILECRVAEMHESRLSPSSCITDALSANLFTKNGNGTSNASAKEEIGFHLSMNVSSASVPHDKSAMKLELFRQQTESTLDSPYLAEPYSSIKLFGKTVVVRDTPKQSLEVAENSESSLCCGVNEKSESNNDNAVNGLSCNNLDSQVGFGFVSETPRPVANIYCHTENMFALPWYTWYHGAMHPNPLLPCEKRADENIADSETPREGSSVGSVNADSLNRDVGQKESSRGFVPYKRCLAERDDKSSMSLLHGQEGRRARVCS